jgi:hypothetical protein
MLPPLAGVEIETEFWFHPTRKWRFDFAFAPFKVAVEIDGRARGNAEQPGRHQRVDGIRNDLEKSRAAVLRGWHVLHYPATDKADALAWAREVRELLRMVDPVLDQCAVCDCTDSDCSQCIERTGEPCYWARAGLCSACADRMPQRAASTKSKS